jgi:AraC-like DNA-binding protein
LDIGLENLNPVKYRNSQLTENASQSLAEKLTQLMKEQQIYRENELGLDKLATRLGVSRHHLSQVINEQFGKNFFEYINSLRIADAQSLLQQQNDDLHIIDIAYQVGFNNKVSFYKAFKNETGMTPTEFRKSKVLV